LKEFAMAKTSPLNLPALDPEIVPAVSGSGYPEAYRAAVAGRAKRRIGNAVGLTHFGVNLVRLAPGAASAQRHWHSDEDEFVYILEGEVELVTDGGAQTLAAGMAAGFPAGKRDGHHLVNRSKGDVIYLEVGDRRPETDEAEYPDIDLRLIKVNGKLTFTHKDGKPW
jgi:uncharacterized cupin superfamily protein